MKDLRESVFKMIVWSSDVLLFPIYLYLWGPLDLPMPEYSMLRSVVLVFAYLSFFSYVMISCIILYILLISECKLTSCQENDGVIGLHVFSVCTVLLPALIESKWNLLLLMSLQSGLIIAGFCLLRIKREDEAEERLEMEELLI